MVSATYSTRTPFLFLGGIAQHLLELAAVIRTACFGAIYVFMHDGVSMCGSVLLGLRQLPLNGLLTLAVAGVACIHYGELTVFYFVLHSIPRLQRFRRLGPGALITFAIKFEIKFNFFRIKRNDPAMVRIVERRGGVCIIPNIIPGTLKKCNSLYNVDISVLYVAYSRSMNCDSVTI